jgi:hypothetical protein
MRHEMNEDQIERIPDFFLEQYRLGEADPETSARIESDPEALRRLADIDADNTLHFERYPTGWFVEQVRRKAAAGTAGENGTAPAGDPIRSIRGFFGNHPFAIPGLAAAILVLALLPYQLLLRSDQAPDDTAAMARGERVKGLEAALYVFRSAPDGSVEQLADGSRVSEGDHLQIAYTAAGKTHGMIFSVDGNGIVTLHYPDLPGDSGALEQGGSTALPFAYVLDDAPRYEQFLFLAASTPIESEDILDEIESNADPQAITTLLTEWTSRDEGRDYQRLSLLKNGDPE